jgi:23S rRNA pseudouridine1911/1915/1917 synthase
MDSHKPNSLTVSGSDAKIRLDKFLTSHFPNYSRSYFQYLIESGFVLVNGEKLKKRTIPLPGDEIEVCFELTPELSLEPENIPLDILFEDEHLIAVNKPPGMVVHPAPGSPNHTFVNALLYHCKTLPDSGNLRPGIVHRLDKDTSGVLLAAKTHEAHQKLVSLFCDRAIQKKYLAVCMGNPGTLEISAPIKRHPTRRQEMAVLIEGKPAISRVKTRLSKEGLSLVEIELVTGRTHQIRVHLKHQGTPVLGDSVYGSITSNKKYEIHRQLLHAHELAFVHPCTHKPLCLSAPIPQDILNFFPDIH